MTATEVNSKLERHGNGKYTYLQGLCHYQGQWEHGVKSGQGRFSMAGVFDYEGDFRAGEMTGQGVKVWADGSRYVGTFLKGEMHGQGTCTKADGESYSGEWVNNRRHGQGTLTLPRGRGGYQGGFIGHRYHGHGALSLPAGISYEGEFVGGLKHGQGIGCFPGGSRYQGGWADDLRHGGTAQYQCGVTGISFLGTWGKDQPLGTPQKISVSVEEALPSADGPPDKAPKKEDKGPKKDEKAKPKDPKAGKGAAAAGPVKDAPPLVPMAVTAAVGEDGQIPRLWCRCVVPAAPTTPVGDPQASMSARDRVPAEAPHPQQAVVTNESGRTLRISLHEVLAPGTEGQPPSLSEARPFAMGRPDLETVSSEPGRYPWEGLVGLYRQGQDCVGPELRQLTLQSRSGDGWVEPGAQGAQAATGEVQGNRCLVLPGTGDMRVCTPVYGAADGGVTVGLDYCLRFPDLEGSQAQEGIRLSAPLLSWGEWLSVSARLESGTDDPPSEQPAEVPDPKPRPSRVSSAKKREPASAKPVKTSARWTLRCTGLSVSMHGQDQEVPCSHGGKGHTDEGSRDCFVAEDQWHSLLLMSNPEGQELTLVVDGIAHALEVPASDVSPAGDAAALMVTAGPSCNPGTLALKNMAIWGHGLDGVQAAALTGVYREWRRSRRPAAEAAAQSAADASGGDQVLYVDQRTCRGEARFSHITVPKSDNNGKASDGARAYYLCVRDASREAYSRTQDMQTHALAQEVASFPALPAETVLLTR